MKKQSANLKPNKRTLSEETSGSNVPETGIPHRITTDSVEAVPGTSSGTQPQRQQEISLQEATKHQNTVRSALSETLYRNKATLLEQQKRPLFLRDIFKILRESVIGKYTASFTVFEPSSIAKTVLLVVEDLPEEVINGRDELLKHTVNHFKNKVVFLDNIPFMQEIKNSYQFTPESPSEENAYSIFFSPEKAIQVSVPENEDEGSPRPLDLLTKPFALMSENCPLPKDAVPFSNSENCRFSKQRYEAVSNESPLYALDCEYWKPKNVKDRILRWTALVDENHRTLYQFEYKGDAKRNDSNIDEVQKRLSEKLPRNAILCGHSINFDLQVLRIIHPYVIDSSIIYQTCENKYKLKELSKILLQENIQETSDHSPIEDSIASIKLVQKKLNETSSGEYDIRDNVLRNSTYYKHGLFPLIESQSKKIAIIGPREAMDTYSPDLVPPNAINITENNSRSILRAIDHHTKKNDFVIAHLSLDCNQDTAQACQDITMKLFNACPKNTLVTVVLAPPVQQVACFRKGLFIKKMKKYDNKNVDFEK